MTGDPSGDRPARQTAHYAPGRLIDVYAGPGAGPAVLLWHGRGPDERTVLEPLARRAAARGLAVYVPDWRSDAPDGGRAHLLASLAFARDAACRDGRDGRLVVAGWSMGGRAAAALALDPAVTGGWRPAAVVCLAAGYTRPGVVTAASPLALAASATRAPPAYLVHGTADTAVSVDQARAFAGALARSGNRVRLSECPSDHAGVIMAEFDPGTGTCRPAAAGHAAAAGRLAVQAMLDAARPWPGREDAAPARQE